MYLGAYGLFCFSNSGIINVVDIIAPYLKGIISGFLSTLDKVKRQGRCRPDIIERRSREGY